MNLYPELWAQGCAMCRAALESSPEGKTIAAGLARGILMMLILPYGLMATFGFIIYRAYRKNSKEGEQKYHQHGSSHRNQECATCLAKHRTIC
jgi:hypothetical protein